MAIGSDKKKKNIYQTNNICQGIFNFVHPYKILLSQSVFLLPLVSHKLILRSLIRRDISFFFFFF